MENIEWEKIKSRFNGFSRNHSILILKDDEKITLSITNRNGVVWKPCPNSYYKNHTMYHQLNHIINLLNLNLNSQNQ